nr:flagellin [uncultured Acetatifactor sp.]
MVVQHNLTAMNSNRMLGLTTKTQAKATEKLSSGYKINRAADDAAGLAISEKMRKQIRGLTQASANAQDGISAVQTAEGALTEVHDMLQRMNELAVKAANGTQSSSDREAIQSEINQLVTEIDRVSITTKFNETYLLKGNNNGEVGKLTYSVATTALANAFGTSTKGVNSSTGVLKAGTTEINSTEGNEKGTAAIKNLTTTNYDQDVVTKIKNSTSISGRTITVTNAAGTAVKYTVIESTSAGGANDYAGTDYASVSEVIGALNQQGVDDGSSSDPTIKAFASMDEMMAAIKNDFGTEIKAISSYITEVDDAGTTGGITSSTGKDTWIKVETFADLNSAVDLSLHVGADSTAENKINMNIAMMSARGLGVNGLKVNGENSANADSAINTIAAALQKVSNQRSSLGAIQNRLEHTINNLDNVVENTQSAESAIRDTDMATQMVTYSNNQILAQAGQAMLAQSNQANQGVLSLLG